MFLSNSKCALRTVSLKFEIVCLHIQFPIINGCAITNRNKAKRQCHLGVLYCKLEIALALRNWDKKTKIATRRPTSSLVAVGQKLDNDSFLLWDTSVPVSRRHCSLREVEREKNVTSYIAASFPWKMCTRGATHHC